MINSPKLTVAEVMMSTLHVVTPDMKVHKAVELLYKHAISGAPLVDQNHILLSTVSEGDLLRLAAKDGFEATLEHCRPHLKTEKDIVTVMQHDTFAEAYKLFLKHSLHRLIVVDAARKVHGIVTRADILRLFIESRYGKKLPPRKF